MDNKIAISAKEKKENISSSGLTIYDSLTPDNKNFWLNDKELQFLLKSYLIGKSYEGQANKTRSKSIKQDICKAMGYPVPKSFKRTHPRFICQNFDPHTQQSDNLQIWNEKISPTRRYCIIGLDQTNTVINVVVISGSTLQNFDTTGTLTTKYQANLIDNKLPSSLLSATDTSNIIKCFGPYTKLNTKNPADYPSYSNLMSIQNIFDQLKQLEGKVFKITGNVRQDGDILQNITYKQLGYTIYKENGQLPDLMNQLLEIKRQTSRTIDLGLFKPNSQEELNIPPINGYVPRICDLRYAIFYCNIKDKTMKIDKVFLSTGEQFFDYFHLFGGNVQNKKIQIHLNRDFWSGE